MKNKRYEHRLVLPAIILSAVVVLMAGCAGDRMNMAEESQFKALSTQELVEKGKSAAEKKDWRRAVIYYTQAQKRAYFSPQIMYNLAVAHAQAGNELLADVWFRAYLGAVPEAANAGQVKAQIARLEKATEAKMDRLFQQAEQLAEQLPLKGEGGNYGHGRRSEALESIAQMRQWIGDFKAEAEDVRRSKQVSMGTWTGYNLEGDDNNYQWFGRTLAELGDIEGAMSLREKIKSDDCRKDLDGAILCAVGSSGDLKEVQWLIDKKYALNEDANSAIAQSLADKGDYAAAETYARKGRYTMSWLYIRWAESQLSQGNISEAVRLANLGGNDSRLMAIRGDAEGAFGRLESGKEMSRFDPSGPVMCLNDIIKYTLYLDDMRNARRAAELADEFVEEGVPDEDGKRYFYDSGNKAKSKEYWSGWTQLGKAYLDVENGSVDDAVKRIDQGSYLVQLYASGDKAEAAASQKRRWLRDICGFSISRGRLDAAERAADSSIEGRERLQFLRQISDAYEDKKDSANVERLKQKTAGLEAEMPPGRDEQKLEREIAVNTWIDAAKELGKHPAVRDIQAYYSEIKKARTQKMPEEVAQAAYVLGRGLIRVHALEKTCGKQ
jgi:hypothetical protein